MDTLERGEWETSSLFSKVEKLVIDYATHVTVDARRVPDDLFEELRANFSEAQIVELTAAAPVTTEIEFIELIDDLIESTLTVKPSSRAMTGTPPAIRVAIG